MPIRAFAWESTLCFRSSAKLRSVPTRLTKEITKRNTKLIKARAKTRANPLFLFFDKAMGTEGIIFELT